ncbi:class I SAM-dependent RNA methyltransferase [Oricola thermophila]|uniref:Class I SAM-dependent RNA methyltransferase n=1 Tax=Oricola thermophila TaxID=2742145 RepID=A0A6N1VHV0_9HYPH|nr:class I SAM-dependent RNA methyltransferase [Oricola thermophila]QKV18902.1 class I SAM-dependent RNA methyltransferase [Oricola thermophila]
MSRTETLTIDELGARGDGVAKSGDGQVFVPYTLAGETVTVIADGRRAALLSVRTPSPDRVEPVCRHFETCGGCALQHMGPDAYRTWKAGLLDRALGARGLDTSVIRQAHFCEPRTRRRAVFSAILTEKGVLLGFQQAASNTVVDIEECHVIAPEIDAARPALKAVLEPLLPAGRTVHATVNLTLSGLDVAVEGKIAPDDRQKRAAADIVRAEGLARLTVNGEIVLAPKRPLVAFDDVMVSPPPGAFLQAVPEMETVMADLVTGHMAKSKRVADLYAGCGTFALRLAKSSTVHAVEGDGPALAALDRGFRDNSDRKLKPVTVERRDLARRPMTAHELRVFDGVVFDPPRAGAEAQAREIAASTVRRVAAISCNPETLARDLAILIQAGFTLKSVTPVDQFIWTPHLEAVALLERRTGRKRHWSDM